MIAVSVLAGWILVGVTFACLWVWWRVLSLTFDLIERRHEQLRAEERRRLVFDEDREAIDRRTASASS